MSASQMPPAPMHAAIEAHAQGYTVQARPTYQVIEGESDDDYTVVLKQVVRYHPLPGHQGIKLTRVWGPCGRIEAERIAVRLTEHVKERDAEQRAARARAGHQ